MIEMPETLEESTDIDALNLEAWNCMIENPKRGLVISKKAYKASEKLGYRLGTANSILNQGWCYNFLAKYEKSLSLLEEALLLFQEINHYLGTTKAFNALGSVYFNLGRFEQALEYYTKSLELGEKHDNFERQIAALNNIGEVLWELKDQKQALSYFNRALVIAEKYNQLEKIGNILVNIGQGYKTLEKYDEATKSLERALEIGENLKDYINQVKSFNLLGTVYLEQGNLEKAEDCHKKALTISMDTGNKLGELEALMSLARIHKERRDWITALSLNKQAHRLVKNIQAKGYLYKICFEISFLYEELGKYKLSLNYLKQSYYSEKEVKNEETNKRIQRITLQYEIDKSKQEAEIYRLKNVELKKKSEELEESYRILKIIDKIGKQITSSLDIRVITETVYKNVNSLMDVSVLAIAKIEYEDRVLDYRFYIEEGKINPGFTIPWDSQTSFGVYSFKNKTVLMLQDAEKEYSKYILKRSHSYGREAESIIYLPLEIKGEIIGLLTVQSYKKNAYTQLQLEMLKALGSYIAIALENYTIHNKVNCLNEIIRKEKLELETAYERIAYMANHDNLTSLPNRRLFYELFIKSIEQTKRLKSLGALLFIDLDDFKPINDSFGHDFGDEVLKVVSQRLVTLLRAADTVARMGGDEFLIILNDVKNKDNAERVVIKILEILRQPMKIRNISCSLGASLGISLFPLDGNNIDTLIKNADIAMYSVKNGKKNGYEFYKA